MKIQDNQFYGNMHKNNLNLNLKNYYFVLNLLIVSNSWPKVRVSNTIVFFKCQTTSDKFILTQEY